MCLQNLNSYIYIYIYIYIYKIHFLIPKNMNFEKELSPSLCLVMGRGDGKKKK